jgi:hypothetical protein
LGLTGLLGLTAEQLNLVKGKKMQLIQTTEEALGVPVSQYEADKLRLTIEKEEKKDFGIMLSPEDPEPYPGYTTTVNREQMSKMVFNHVQIGLKTFLKPGRVCWNRAIQAQSLRGLLFTNYIYQDYISEGKKFRIILPRFISVYPPENKMEILIVLKEVNVMELKSIYSETGVIQEFTSGKWECLLGESSGSKTVSKFIEKILNHTGNIELANKIIAMSEAEKLEDANAYLDQSAYHEMGHVVALRMKDELLELWGDLVDEEIAQILETESQEAGIPIGIFLLQDMIKGRGGAITAEEEGRINKIEMTKEEIARVKFLVEIFSDKWALFVHEKLGIDNSNFARSGLKLTEKQRAFFEQYLLMLIQYGDDLLVINEEWLENKVLKTTGLIAASNMIRTWGMTIPSVL